MRGIIRHFSIIKHCCDSASKVLFIMLFGYCHHSLVFKTRSAINVANKISFIVLFGFSVGFLLEDSSVNGDDTYVPQLAAVFPQRGRIHSFALFERLCRLNWRRTQASVFTITLTDFIRQNQGFVWCLERALIGRK